MSSDITATAWHPAPIARARGAVPTPARCSERSVAHALVCFVDRLVRDPQADPQALMAAALGDPSLTIVFPRSHGDGFIDTHGAPMDVYTEDRAVTLIERDSAVVAAVMYDPELAEHEEFVRAAGAIALMQIDKTRLQADLVTSTFDLVAARARVLKAADAERRRLERDLHDSVQQRIVGLRLKLELATEIVKQDPAEGERALAALGDDIDAVLEELRSLARGVYPALLRSHGPVEALRSAVRASPLSVSVHTRDMGRYREELEIAVYFCCLEAVQNAAKHAGPQATVTITFWRNGRNLCFEVHDTGVGLDADAAPSGHGLINMHDRIDAVGGTLRITSGPELGTTVRGTVPVDQQALGNSLVRVDVVADRVRQLWSARDHPGQSHRRGHRQENSDDL